MLVAYYILKIIKMTVEWFLKLGIAGGMELRDGVDASGRKAKVFIHFSTTFTHYFSFAIDLRIFQ